MINEKSQGISQTYRKNNKLWLALFPNQYIIRSKFCSFNPYPSKSQLLARWPEGLFLPGSQSEDEMRKPILAFLLLICLSAVAKGQGTARA